LKSVNAILEIKCTVYIYIFHHHAGKTAPPPKKKKKREFSPYFFNCFNCPCASVGSHKLFLRIFMKEIMSGHKIRSMTGRSGGEGQGGTLGCVFNQVVISLLIQSSPTDRQTSQMTVAGETEGGGGLPDLEMT